VRLLRRKATLLLYAKCRVRPRRGSSRDLIGIRSRRQRGMSPASLIVAGGISARSTSNPSPAWRRFRRGAENSNRDGRSSYRYPTTPCSSCKTGATFAYRSPLKAVTASTEGSGSATTPSDPSNSINTTEVNTTGVKIASSVQIELRIDLIKDALSHPEGPDRSDQGHAGEEYREAMIKAEQLICRVGD
jgi:hypothetical protein